MITLWDAAAMIVSLAALAVAVITVRRSDRNASAATLVSLYEALRAAWGRYLKAKKPDQTEFEFAELVNLLELACAVYLDGGVHGAAREMLKEYLLEVLEILRDDEVARRRITSLMDRPNTYKYLKRFLRRMRQEGQLSASNALVSHAVETQINGSA